MTQRTHRDFIQDILDCINDVESFTQEINFEQFIDDKKTFLAVTRSVEIIGEATKNIPKAIRDKYPDVPWKKMAGMRDHLVHGYFGVDLEILWEMVKKDLPPLKSLIQKVLSNYK